MISRVAMLRRSLQLCGVRQRGQALLELTVVTPVLLILLLGTAELAHAFHTHITLVNVSRDGARLAARGNLFPHEDILFVIEQHAGNLNLASRGSVIMTIVECTSNGYAITRETLLGAATTRLDDTTLQTLHQEAISTAPEERDYLNEDHFVVVEVFYEHSTITGFLWQSLPMYAYTIMPISGPS